MGNDAVLDARDAGREVPIIGVDAEFGFSGVEVLLDVVGVLGSPLVGFAVADEVVVG